MTLNQLYAKCWKHHWDTERFRKSGWAKEVAGLYSRHIRSPLGEEDIKTISVKQLREFHQELGATPYNANRCLEVVSKLYSFAQENEILPPWSNPARLVKSFPERKRSRYASPEEVARVGARIREYSDSHPVETAFLMLLALTGARPRSIERARRDELQRVGDVGVLVFEGKSTEGTGYEETVIIPVEAMQILDRLPLHPKGLLIGRVKYRPIWEKIREEADCPGLWVRDLRRTFASFGLSMGVGKDLIGRLLNHHSPSTTDKYAMLLPQARIAAARVIGKEINGRLHA